MVFNSTWCGSLIINLKQAWVGFLHFTYCRGMVDLCLGIDCFIHVDSTTASAFVAFNPLYIRAISLMRFS